MRTVGNWAYVYPNHAFDAASFIHFLFRATSKGFKPDAIDRCLEEYEGLDVWQLNQARSKLTITNNLK